MLRRDWNSRCARHPFAERPPPTKRDEPQPMSAGRTWSDVLHLDQLRNERESVLGNVEVREHVLDRCADRNCLPDPMTHVPGIITVDLERRVAGLVDAMGLSKFRGRLSVLLAFVIPVPACAAPASLAQLSSRTRTSALRAWRGVIRPGARGKAQSGIETTSSPGPSVRNIPRGSGSFGSRDSGGRRPGWRKARRPCSSACRQSDRVGRGSDGPARARANVAAAMHELAAARKHMPMVRVERDYAFEGPDGERSLPELFDGRSQLILYRFFFEEGVRRLARRRVRRMLVLRRWHPRARPPSLSRHHLRHGIAGTSGEPTALRRAHGLGRRTLVHDLHRAVFG